MENQTKVEGTDILEYSECACCGMDELSPEEVNEYGLCSKCAEPVELCCWNCGCGLETFDNALELKRYEDKKGPIWCSSSCFGASGL